MRKLLLILLLLLIFLPLNLKAEKSFKAFVCNMYVGNVIKNDKCDGTNSWYKVYFPEKFKSKEICMKESHAIFNDPQVMEMYPDYKKPGDERKAWVAGCDNLWTY